MLSDFSIIPAYSSALEFAVKADYNDNITAAALYRFNKWGYDIQFLAGYVESVKILWQEQDGQEHSVQSPSGEKLHGSSHVRILQDTTGTGIFTFGFDKTFKNN